MQNKIHFYTSRKLIPASAAAKDYFGTQIAINGGAGDIYTTELSLLEHPQALFEKGYKVFFHNVSFEKEVEITEKMMNTIKNIRGLLKLSEEDLWEIGNAI